MGRTLLALLVLLLGAAGALAYYQLPPQPPRHAFGTVVLDRASSAAGKKPVIFSHWVHRQHYTCSVCHGELEFNMAGNTTPIAEEGHLSPRYCGACHDGERAFTADANCARCHRAQEDYDPQSLARLDRYPLAHFGNGVDWVQALRRGFMTPARFLEVENRDVPFDKELLLEAEMGRIPPAVFPHRAHNEWMDCNICHPQLFNIKKKGTKHFSMERILRGEFCGACHLNVAFPMDDCQRCHPGMRQHAY